VHHYRRGPTMRDSLEDRLEMLSKLDAGHPHACGVKNPRDAASAAVYDHRGRECTPQERAVVPTAGQTVARAFRAKWTPVRVKKTRQNKRLEPGSDSIRTDKAPG
jgi:hypothetical protein